jgi:intracellular septation protein A
MKHGQYSFLYLFFSNVNNSSTLEELFALCYGQLVLVVPNEKFIKVNKEKL